MSDETRSAHVRRPLYWLGNSAKTSIVAEILERHQAGEALLIFDYGCGDGGDWPKILGEHSSIKLIGYEPDPASFRQAQQRLEGYNVELHTGEEIASLQLRADYIVSFSVLEHVCDRTAFLSHAKRLLADGGMCFLNYDDGHFRYGIEFNRPSTWGSPLREWLRSTMSPPLAALGLSRRYQRRVVAEDIDRLIARQGFSIQRVAYHNLTCLKQLYKTVPSHQQEAFVRHWLEIESALNRDCAANMTVVCHGDRVNLWQYMPTRTLYLRHK